MVICQTGMQQTRQQRVPMPVPPPPPPAPPPTRRLLLTQHGSRQVKVGSTWEHVQFCSYAHQAGSFHLRTGPGLLCRAGR